MRTYQCSRYFAQTGSGEVYFDLLKISKLGRRQRGERFDELFVFTQDSVKNYFEIEKDEGNGLITMKLTCKGGTYENPSTQAVRAIYSSGAIKKYEVTFTVGNVDDVVNEHGCRCIESFLAGLNRKMSGLEPLSGQVETAKKRKYSDDVDNSLGKKLCQ